MGSQHPSPNLKTFCKFEPQIWLEIIRSRDAESTCFTGSRTSCREIIFGIFWPNFGRKRSHHVMDASCRCKGNGCPRKGNRRPRKGNRPPGTGTEALLIVENVFKCIGSSYGFNCRGPRGAPQKWPKYRTPARAVYIPLKFFKTRYCPKGVLPQRCSAHF